MEPKKNLWGGSGICENLTTIVSTCKKEYHGNQGFRM